MTKPRIRSVISSSVWYVLRRNTLRALSENTMRPTLTESIVLYSDVTMDTAKSVTSPKLFPIEPLVSIMRTKSRSQSKKKRAIGKFFKMLQISCTSNKKLFFTVRIWRLSFGNVAVQ